MFRSLVMGALLLPCGFALVGCGGQPRVAAPAATEKAADAVAKNAAGKLDVPTPRKIRYTATVHIVVRNLDDASAEVEDLVDRHRGYIAKTERIGSSGLRRVGTWTIKVPVEQYRDLVQSLAKLGFVERNSSDSEDMTEEFVDLQARLKNMKVEEEALNKLLKDGANKIEDVLKIRDHIVKVRGDIERAEGRLKFVESATSLSTVNLTLREDAEYVSPTAPTFSGEISDAFDSSTRSLKQTGRAAVIGAVAVAPWLPLIVIAGLVVRYLYRKGKSLAEPAVPNRRRAREPNATAVEPNRPDPESPG